MSQLGKAYIEVTADLKKFPAELRAKLKAAMATAVEGVEFTALDRKAEQAGSSAAAHVSTGFKKKARRELENAGEAGGRSLLSGLGKLFSRNSSGGSGFFSTVSGFFKDVFAQAGQAASSFGDIGSNIGGAFSKLGDIGGEIGSVLKIAGIAIIIPVVIQLAGALVQLGAALFALPAAAGVALGILAPLIIAFQGFGEAVGAGLSGNVDKFNQALKGLPASMRSVVKEVVGLKGIFSSVKTGIQEAFFQPLVGVVGPAIRSFLGVVGPGLRVIAGDLGRLTATLLKTFTTPENLRTFAALLATASRVVQTMAPGVSALAQGLLNLIQPALPFIERGAAAFTDFANHVEAFTRNIGKSGQLTSWLDRAAHILSTLVGLAKDFAHYLIVLLGGEIGDNATKFLDEFKVKLRQLLEYMQSPDGKEAIHNLGVLLQWVGNIFLFLIDRLPALFKGFNGFFNAVRLVARVLSELGGAVATGARAVGGFFVDVWNWVKTAGRAIGNFFTDTIPHWWDSVVSFFESLPGRALAGLASLADTVRNFLINALQGWYDAVFTAIGRIIGIFLGLPQIIPMALDRLGQLLSDLWDAIWQNAVDHFWLGVHAIQAVIEAVPGLLDKAGAAIKDFFSGLWYDVILASYNYVVSGFNRVIDFFSSLPGRIRALGPKLYEAAVWLGRKIGEGLSNIGSFASDVGGKIVSTIKSGINYVIGRINAGIAQIDDKLPGDLPRIPMLARGAVVDSPTLALVGEAGPEVVVPLTNRRRAQELAEQSGLLKMLRGAGGSGTNVTVIAYLDPTGALIPVVKTVVNDSLDDQGDAVPYARAA